jgi:chaperonin cofactor prefoldin
MSKVYKCDICIKNYKTYQTLWKHNKKFHPPNIHNLEQKINTLGQNINTFVCQKDDGIIKDNTANNTCNFCNKTMSCYKSLRRHLGTCKVRKSVDNENKQLKSDLESLKEHIKELLNTHNKIHPKTLQKMINNSNNTNNNSNNTNNTNNGTINNVNIISLGNENIPALFNTTEKLEVLNKKNNALYHLIEKVHFNDNYPQFKNIFITNNRHNEAHLYDINSNKFKVVDKEEAINDIIEYRVCDIEEFYEELGEKLDPKAKDILENLFRERGDDDITRDRVKLLIYNNKKN